MKIYLTFLLLNLSDVTVKFAELVQGSGGGGGKMGKGVGGWVEEGVFRLLIEDYQLSISPSASLSDEKELP